MTSTQHPARDPRQQERAATAATVTVLPPAGTSSGAPTEAPTDAKALARAALMSRHSQGLSRLYTERDDLRGVHALADFVHDSIRWTA